MEKHDKDAGVSFIGFKNACHDPNFWLHGGGEDSDSPRLIDPANYETEELKKKQPVRSHVAFTAPSRKDVDQWYHNALYVPSSISVSTSGSGPLEMMTCSFRTTTGKLELSIMAPLVRGTT